MEADGITPAGNKDGIQLRSFAARNVIELTVQNTGLISATSRDGISSMDTYGNLIEETMWNRYCRRILSAIGS